MSLAMMYQQRARRRMKPQYGMTATPAQQPAVSWGNEGSIAASQGGIATAATGYGQQGTSDYWNRISTFDPSEAINKYAQGAWNARIGGPGGFNDQLTQFKGNSVAGGRLDTGFYDEGVGQLYRSTVNDFSNNVAQTAVQGAQMQMRNNEAIGQFGDTQTERGLDLGVARREELINNAREKAERKRRSKRGIAGLLGGAAGGIIGGLAGGVPGAMVGYQVGRGLGGGG